jgi:predicted HicB family RNase H-like nuclease
MAKRAAGKKMQTATADPPKRTRNGIAVRLDLPPADHERASRMAREQGLSLASFARMALYRLMKETEGGAR